MSYTMMMIDDSQKYKRWDDNINFDGIGRDCTNSVELCLKSSI